MRATKTATAGKRRARAHTAEDLRAEARRVILHAAALMRAILEDRPRPEWNGSFLDTCRCDQCAAHRATMPTVAEFRASMLAEFARVAALYGRL